ncbi:prepilin-type N-terminal cleavage/methylation domain-containing protein [bacterium]|nr:MAG: prepilin-type N-terminal cleavage/methylation domain-containing protein [bacterium]
MLSKIRNRQKGFTLIELLIVIAIIGIIAALLIPNFLDALQKAKQKRTVADMRNTGTAFFSWLTDVNSAAAAGQATTTFDTSAYTTCDDGTQLENVLVPQYTQSVPKQDGWKTAYNYCMNAPTAARVLMIQSAGRDTALQSGTLTVEGFDPTDYDQDIIWADGYFVRWPQRLEGTATP